MGELRIRVIRDMTVRGLAPRTHEAYLAAVVRLAKHFRRRARRSGSVSPGGSRGPRLARAAVIGSRYG